MPYREKLSFSDYSLKLMDDHKRSLDFVIVMELKAEVTLTYLQKGAALAFKVFPQSNSKMQGKYFVELNDSWKMDEAEGDDHKTLIAKYIETPFDLEHERGIRQLFLKTQNKNILVTRFHHALGDFVSFLLWSKVQLTHQRPAVEKIELKTFSGKRPIHSPFRYKKKVMTIGNHQGKISSLRNWSVFKIPKPQKEWKEFSYNDFLSAILMESLREYNLTLGISEHRNGLYIPINVRTEPFKGFGNGSSRLKIYDRYAAGTSLSEIAKNLRAQTKKLKEMGFWAMPSELGWFGTLPQWLGSFLLNYVGMPLTEPGSLIFSHVERWDGFEEIFEKIHSLIGVSQLHKSYPLNMGVVSIQNESHFTLTWDENIIKEEQAIQFLGIFKSKLELALQ